MNITFHWEDAKSLDDYGPQHYPAVGAVVAKRKNATADPSLGTVWYMALVLGTTGELRVHMWSTPPFTIGDWVQLDAKFDTIEEAKAYAQAIVVLDGMT